MTRQPFGPAPAGGVAVRLPGWLRSTLGDLCGQLETLVRGEDPSSDPAVARLFPAAYPDDPLAELEYERRTADGLAAGRLEALERMRSTLDADVLDEVHALAWLSTLNDVRLVIGSRLDVTEESTPADYADDQVAAGTFDLYLLLGEVQALLIQAIDPDAVEPELTAVEPSEPVDGVEPDESPG